MAKDSPLSRKAEVASEAAAAPDPAQVKASTEAHLEFDRALIDAERIMMQVVQTSLSLIGFGFTITEFFNGAAASRVRPDAQGNARLLGEALLVLGLLLLGLGIWNQASYRRRLIRHLRRTPDLGRPAELRYLETPSFVVAILLFLVGCLTLASVFFRSIF